MTDLSKNVLTLREKKAVVEMGGGEASIAKQKAMGKRQHVNASFRCWTKARFMSMICL